MIYSRFHEVEQMVHSLPVHEQRKLVDSLRRRLEEKASALQPIELEGAWKDDFPDEFDIDSALNEIRNQWIQDDAA